MTARNCTQCGRLEDPPRRSLCHACYERHRRAGRVSSLVDPTETMWHISQLRFMGLGTRTIAGLAGVDRSVVQKIINGEPNRYINARSAAAIMAVPIPEKRVCLEWSGANHQRRLKKNLGCPIDVNGQTIYVMCGDCEHYPCRCPRIDDADVPLLGHIEGGEPLPERQQLLEVA